MIEVTVRINADTQEMSVVGRMMRLITRRNRKWVHAQLVRTNKRTVRVLIPGHQGKPREIVRRWRDVKGA